MRIRNFLVVLVALAASFMVNAQPGMLKLEDLKEPGAMGTVSPDSSDYRMLIGKKMRELYSTQSDISFVTVKSGPGESASGVVVQRNRDSIAIDMTPCLPKKTVRYFIRPYGESSISDEQCGEKTYKRVQVIQLSPGR